MARIQLLLDPSTATTTTIPLAENGDSDVMIVLPDTNAFLRRVLYEQIEVRFNTRVMVKKNEANKLCVYKMEGRYTVNDYGSSEFNSGDGDIGGNHHDDIVGDDDDGCDDDGGGD